MRRPPGLAPFLVLLLLGSGWTPPAGAQETADVAPPTPAAMAGRSLIVPGWGQWAQGQRRAAAYAVAELALWVFWGERRGDAAELRDRYRELAWTVARGGGAGRVDGAWAYYETLSKWTRSGAFDADTGAPGIQPEEDPATYNGAQWRLARDLHFGGGSPAPGDPRYEAAVAWYSDHAYGDAFRWDWRGNEPRQAEFNDLIDRSDARFRQATTLLGAVLANHFLSAADAYVSAQVPGAVRLRVATPERPTAPFFFTVSWTPHP